MRPDGDPRGGSAVLPGAAAAVAGARAEAHAGGHAMLPGVLVDVPVAVLVIDRTSGSVTYANTAAVELAGTVHLPVDVDTWGAEAGLTDLSGLVQGLRVASMATMVHARAVPPAGARRTWRIEVANAGHPPVLLRGPEGEVRLLDGATGLLVGVDASTQRTTRVVELPIGSTLLAYTDGLVQRPGEDLDTGIAELAARLAAAPASGTPAELCAAAVSGVLDRRDDVALLAVRFC